MLDRLVLQHGDERGPSRVVHGLGQAGPCEAGHREVFHIHRSVVADDLCGRLVVPVPAPVGHLGVLACDLDTGLGPVLRSLGLTGQLPLKAPELLLRPAQKARAVNFLAVGQDREGGQAEIETDFRRHLGKNIRLGIHDETEEVPAGAVFGDGQGRGCGRKPAGPPDLEVADLGHVHRAVAGEGEGVGGEADRLPGVLLRLVAGRADPAALPLALDRVEEVPVGGIQVPQGLLQDHRRHLGQPGAFLGPLGLGEATPGQLGRLHIRQSRRVRFLQVAQAVIPHHSGAPERTRQRATLRNIRVDPVVVAELHTQEPTTVDLTDEQNDYRRGRHVVSARHVHLVFVTKYQRGNPGTGDPQGRGGCRLALHTCGLGRGVGVQPSFGTRTAGPPAAVGTRAVPESSRSGRGAPNRPRQGTASRPFCGKPVAAGLLGLPGSSPRAPRGLRDGHPPAAGQARECRVRASLGPSQRLNRRSVSSRSAA